MIIKRICTAVILLTFIGLLLFFTTPSFFAVAIGIICGLCSYELLSIYKFSLTGKLIILVIGAGLLFSCFNLIYYHIDLLQHFPAVYDLATGEIMRAVIIATWCFLIPLILFYHPKRLSKIAVCYITYLLFLPVFYALLNLHKYLLPQELLIIMAVAWISDSSAYFIGRLIGKHKLAPKISPGKSIEGAIAGVVAVIVYLLLVRHFYPTCRFLYSYVAVIKVAVILAVVSILGDLFESWLKRVAQVKDSGNILPGHGGVFDRIDSLIAVVSVAYALLYGWL